jgi:sensor histidine kinase YesM
MEPVIITKEDVQDIVLTIKITFLINCVIVIFVFILNSNVDVLTQFLGAQSIGLTVVTIIRAAKILYPPFKNDYKKLYCFLPIPVLLASLIGINFLQNLTSLPELIVLVAIITMPAMLLFQYKDNHVKAKKALSLEQNKSSENNKALLANKLLLLQAEINPHFLFNTLDNIKQYIISDPKKAERLLIDYTLFLRQSLPSTQTTQGTISDELALINAYIAIQQTRFPHIRFIEKLDERLKNVLFPPLLIQPLIDNAITHGLAPQGHQGLITLTVRQELDKLIIEVCDTGVGFGDLKEDKKSVALKNIKARLKLHHTSSSLTMLIPEQGTMVQIVMPINED